MIFLEIWKTLINQVYHPYWLWEEVAHNMWGSVENNEDYLERAITFTGDHILYGSWMKKVVDDWPYSCEHNLSNITQNRKAWLGRAACAYAFGCPEDIVRQAWWHLTDEQRTLANIQAENNIKIWEWRQCQKGQLELVF